MLKRRGIKHDVLNAKYHDKEAEIVAQAGKKGAVTIATNMAGRGTDIMLGGNAEYMAKADLRRMQVPEELIAEATGFAETDNEDILNARTDLPGAEAKNIRTLSSPRRRRSGRRAACSSWAPSATSPAGSTTSSRGRSGRQGDPGHRPVLPVRGGRPDASVRRRPDARP